MNERTMIDLATIEEGLERLGRQSTIDALLPGIAAVEVREVLGDEGFKSHPILEAWFSWHNGTSDLIIDTSQIFVGYYPLSLEEAMHTAKTYRDLNGWDATWLPLLADGGGYFYLEDQSPAGSGAIRCYRCDQASHPIEYRSLETFISSIAEGYRQKAFCVHPDGYLSPNIPIYERIAARLNPGVAWWN